MQANDILEDGSSLIQSGCSEGIGIKEMCKMLKCTLDRFTQKLEGRRLALVSCIEFHQLVRQVCDTGLYLYQELVVNIAAVLSNGSCIMRLRTSTTSGFLDQRSTN